MPTHSKAKRFGLKGKLIVSMLVAGILPFILGMGLSYVQGNKSLHDVIGSNFETLARETANKIDFVIEKEIAKNRQTAEYPDIREWTEQQSKALLNETPAQMESEGVSGELKKNAMRGIVENNGAQTLRFFLKESSHSSDSVLAFFITDTRGKPLASINDYPPLVSHQEEIVNKVLADGVYLSGVHRDKKSGAYVFKLILPIFGGQSDNRGAIDGRHKSIQSPGSVNSKPMIGLLHRVYLAKQYFSPPLESIHFGDTGHVMVVDNKGVVIDCPVLPTGFQIPEEQVVRAATLPNAGWALTQGNGHGSSETSIIGFSPLFKSNALLEKSSGSRWHMFVWQASDELFAPTRKLLVWNSTAAVFGIFLIALMGTYAANKIINPIRKLQKAIGEIGREATEKKQSKIEEIRVDAEDEIGELATAFNKMSKNLKTAQASDLKHIEELEQTLMALAESETRVTTIMNNVVDGIITIDERGLIVSFNFAAERIFGYATREIIGKNVSLLIPEPDKSKHDGYIETYLKTGQAKIIGFGREVTGQRRDGSEFPMDLAVSEMSIGERRLFVGVARDITLRKSMEGDLRKLSRAVEQSPSSVMITDAQGNIEYVNPNFLQTTGYAYPEVVGKKPSILKSGIHPPQFYTHLWETILSGKEWRGEFCNRKKSGDLFWELQSISPLRDSEGNITHFLSVKIDDTERKRAETQLKLYAAELERSNDSLKDFAAIASHDLQEPLRKIVSFGDRLMKDYGLIIDERGRDYLDRMQIASQRMRNFIYDLLEYSKVASKPRAFAPVDLGNVVTEVLGDLEARIKQTGGQVNVANLPVIDADELLIRQLFQNLISNALKFHKPNVPPIVDLSCRYTSRGFWEISVEDNGIGFDMKYHDRIFKPFQRLHGRTQYEGSGMGLAICQKIVTVHGGIFSARSEPQMGTKFIVLLPERQVAKQTASSL